MLFYSTGDVELSQKNKFSNKTVENRILVGLVDESNDDIMAFSKAHLYSRNERKVARAANALGHPARIKMLAELRQGEMTYGQILANHPFNKGTLTHHLKTLRLSGLVGYYIRENTYCYFLLWEELPNWVESLLSDAEGEQKKDVAKAG